MKIKRHIQSSILGLISLSVVACSSLEKNVTSTYSISNNVYYPKYKFKNDEPIAFSLISDTNYPKPQKVFIYYFENFSFSNTKGEIISGSNPAERIVIYPGAISYYTNKNKVTAFTKPVIPDRLWEKGDYKFEWRATPTESEISKNKKGKSIRTGYFSVE